MFRNGKAKNGKIKKRKSESSPQANPLPLSRESGNPGRLRGRQILAEVNLCDCIIVACESEKEKTK